MPKQTDLSNATVNGQAADLIARLTGGSLELRTGAGAGSNNPATGTLVCTLPINGTPTNVNGVITILFQAAAIAATVTNIGDGTGGTTQMHGRYKTQAGGSIMEVTAGPGAASFNIDLGGTSLTQNTQCTIQSATHEIRRITAGY